VKQGATLLQFKPTNAVNFIKLTIIFVLSPACFRPHPLPRSTQLYKTVA